MEVYSFEKIMEKTKEFNEYKELYQVVQNKIGEKKGEKEMDWWEEAYTLSSDHCLKRLTFYNEHGGFVCNFLIDREPLIRNNNNVTHSFYLNYSNKEAVDNWCSKVKTIHYWDGHKTHIYENPDAFTMYYNDKAIELYVSCELADYRCEEKELALKEVKISKPEQYYMIYVKFSNNTESFPSDKVYAYEVGKNNYDVIDIGDIYQIAAVINRNPLINTLAASGDLSSDVCNIPQGDIIKDNYRNSYIQIVGMETVPSSKMILTSWRFIATFMLETTWSFGKRNFYRENWENDIHYYDNNFHIAYRHKCKCGEISTNSLDTVKDYCAHPEKLKAEEDKIDGIKIETDRQGQVWDSVSITGATLYTPEGKEILTLGQSETEKFKIEQTFSTIEETKEENTMSKLFDNVSKNMQFGKYTTNMIKYSLNGIAFMDANGDYFVYNGDTAVDVTGMTMDAPMFVMPIAVNQIQPNDVIIFKDTPVIVKENTEDGIKVINPLAGEVRVIIPEVNIFGFNYITKVINPFDNIAATASKDNPFGNLLPLMMLGDGITKGNDGDMMKFLMMNQMMGSKMDFTSNPMMLYFLMNDNGDNDFFPMMMLMGGLPGMENGKTSSEE